MSILRAYQLPLLLLTIGFPLAPLLAQEAPSEEILRAEVIGIFNDRGASVGDAGGEALRLRLVTGTDAGKEITVGQRSQGPWLPEKEETVVVRKLARTDGSIEYSLAEAYRFPALLWIAVLFAGLCILLGGKKGVGSLSGLILSIGILVFFVVPRIANGADPVTTSLIGALAIASTSLFLAHGFKKRTFAAFLSTLATLAIAAGLAAIFVHAAKLFGAGSEEALFLQNGALEHVNLRGLLLGGIIIGCLGVLDDVTVAQTAVVDEIRKANPSLAFRSVMHASMSVGKEHIASMINTLALAYAGASMPLLLLFTTPTDYPLWFTLNGEFLAEEIIRTLVGSTALLFAVPIATVCAMLLLRHPDSPPQSHSSFSATYGHHS